VGEPGLKEGELRLCEVAVVLSSDEEVLSSDEERLLRLA
jgi:hypothetical protein